MESHLKVFAYIQEEGRLLVFRHTHFPEAGIQVPGGSVEPGEPLEAAAVREAEEETGLRRLRIVEYLGSDEMVFQRGGVDELHIRHFYYLEPGAGTFPDDVVPERWVHYERTPSDGSPGPIEFEFFWVARSRKPNRYFEVELSYGLGALLSRLI